MHTNKDDLLKFMPLGAGQEVGRSCHYLEFKGKRVLIKLDCGIHPGLEGLDSLPFFDFINCEQLDLLLVTHFHLDHCGALPWFLSRTAFRGRCFMTHATKSIYHLMLNDVLKLPETLFKIARRHGRESLYTEEELKQSMDKIEVLDFHSVKEVNGIKFWGYVAGHVLGAAMFMIEIAGVRVLYTGDFSCAEDRHLCSAEIPNITPHVMICESTYGTQIHECMEDREKRFKAMVHEVVSRGGRCLIPVFALGRAQELLLILDEYWEQHSELHDIPIYYASSLARKCMTVYQTYVSGMNRKIQRQIAIDNPFLFKHVMNLKSINYFDDVGPSVVLASPGMLQSGLSRDLFERWCADSRNGCIVAGYCVEGTLARNILSEPNEINTLSGYKLPMRMQVSYISFSAHTDYVQTSKLIRAMKPSHLIFVHGEKTEMGRLKAGIMRQYEGLPDYHIEVYTPKNTELVSLYFRGEKMAKVVGKLAKEAAMEDGERLSGVLLRRNFDYYLIHPDEVEYYAGVPACQLPPRPVASSNVQLPIEQKEGMEWISMELNPGERKLKAIKEEASEKEVSPAEEKEAAEGA